MNEIPVNEYGRVVSLIEKNETQGVPTAVYAVLEGTRPGRVLTDDPDEPQMAIVDAPGGLYLFGDPDPRSLRQLVPELLDGRLPANGRPLWYTSQAWRGEGNMLWATSAAWQEVLQSLFSIKGSKRVFEFSLSSWTPVPNWQSRLPADFVLRPIHDRAIGWEGKDVDPEKSFGFCLLSGDQVVSRCVCEFLGRREAEITIRTDAAFQRRGFASLTCAAFIEECLANGLRPAWSCDTTNTASAGLAEKLGFTKSVDRIGYFLHPSFQVLDGKWGPPQVPDIRGYEGEAIVQEAAVIVGEALDAGVSAFSLLPGRQGVSIWHHFGEAAQEVGSRGKERQDPLLARFKHLTEMNTDEQGCPQFGRCGVTHHDIHYSLHMTCLPSTYGDEILIHLSGRPSLKRISVRTRAEEDLWMHLAEEQAS